MVGGGCWVEMSGGWRSGSQSARHRGYEFFIFYFFFEFFFKDMIWV